MKRASLFTREKHRLRYLGCYFFKYQRLISGQVLFSVLARRYGGNFADEFKKVYDLPNINRIEFSQHIPNTLWQTGKIHAVGYLEKVIPLHKELVFARMTGPSGSGNTLQLVTRQAQFGEQLQKIALHSPISIVGNCRIKSLPKNVNKLRITTESDYSTGSTPIRSLEVDLTNLICLNTIPESLRIGKDQVFMLDSRHMQIRHDDALKKRLIFRSNVAKAVREFLYDFHEIETPILFKSTPEGANEFLVPSRKRGFAYALPQSPQQYKQILIASGIDRYFQFAKCFRDEDLRADRQPEFTQIDLEMSFADGKQVIELVESLIKSIYIKFADQIQSRLNPYDDRSQTDTFPRMTYNEAMSRYGSDKPDLRIVGSIFRIDKFISKDLCHMLTDIPNPVIETCKLRLNSSPNKIQNFVRKFMDSADSLPFRSNSDGPPGFAVYDSAKPISGLQIFSFEGYKELEKLFHQQERILHQSQKNYLIDTKFEQGDLFLIQARKDLPHSGGYTMLGKLRIALYKAAIEEGLIESDLNHYYLWVTDFPLFTLNYGNCPGEYNKSRFYSTHHPFTAPKTAKDVDFLIHDPEKATADHYDLVVNGVEIGGGSRRIHIAEMQKFVMKNVLKLSDNHINDFSHLFKVLAAGCPPHAGIALGFDRLMAILTNQESVKDVIAFPKSSKGDDLLVKSPSSISSTLLDRYHLILKPSNY